MAKVRSLPLGSPAYAALVAAEPVTLYTPRSTPMPNTEPYGSRRHLDPAWPTLAAVAVVALIAALALALMSGQDWALWPLLAVLVLPWLGYAAVRLWRVWR